MYSVRHTFLPNLPYYILGSVSLGMGISILKSTGVITGGFPGLALIIYTLWGTFTIGTILLMLNAPTLIFAYRIKGGQFLVIVILSMVLVSAVTDMVIWLLLDKLPNVSYNRLTTALSAVVSGVFLGTGLSMFVNKQANTGGLMIIAQWLGDKTQIPLPYFVFGQDIVILSIGLMTVLSLEQFIYSIFSITTMAYTMQFWRKVM